VNLLDSIHFFFKILHYYRASFLEFIQKFNQEKTLQQKIIIIGFVYYWNLYYWKIYWFTISSKLLKDYRSKERLSASEGNREENRINVISSLANSYAYSREYFSNRNTAIRRSIDPLRSHDPWEIPTIRLLSTPRGIIGVKIKASLYYIARWES